MRSLIWILILFSSPVLSQTTWSVTNNQDAGAGSLRNAILLANDGDTIAFDSSAFSNNRCEISVLSPIVIDKSIALIGSMNSSDSVVLNGGDSIQLLRVFFPYSHTGNENVYLHNLVLEHGNSNVERYPWDEWGQGGALYARTNDTLIVRNCIMRFNLARQAGEHVYVNEFGSTGGHIEFHQCSFSQSPTDYSNDRSIFVESNNFVMDSCTVKRNTCAAMYVHCDSTITISNSSFLYNGINPLNGNSTVAGTMIVTGKVRVNNCTFEGNHGEGGAGLYIGNSYNSHYEVLVSNSTFTKNHSSASGGGLHLSVFLNTNSIRPTVENCVFEENTASDHGSAAWVNHAFFEHCQFNKNQTGAHGAIYFERTNFAQVNRCVFDSNYSANGTSAIYTDVTNDSLNILNSSFVQNHSDSAGGTVHLFSEIAKIGNCTFSQNHSSDWGTLNLHISNKVSIYQNTFAFNTSTLPTGGAIYFPTASTATLFTKVIRGNLFYQNTPYNVHSRLSSNLYTSEGFNLLDNASSHFQRHPADIIIANPSLIGIDSLTWNNIDSLPVHPLLSQSLAINLGSPIDSSQDQLGVSPFLRKDIGAVESTFSHINVYNSPSICDSIEINGTYYTSPQLLIDSTLTTNGTDSITYHHLYQFHSSKNSVKSVYTCNPYTWIDGQTYINDTSGIYYTLQTVFGCDSVVELQLDIVEKDKSFQLTTGQIEINYTSNTASYQWQRCDALHTVVPWAGNSRFLNFTNDGEFRCRITDADCTWFTDCIDTKTVGLHQNGLHPEVRLYPNPSNGLVTVEANNVSEYSITNSAGVIMNSELVESSNNVQLELPEAPGIYFIELIFSDGTHHIEKVMRL